MDAAETSPAWVVVQPLTLPSPTKLTCKKPLEFRGLYPFQGCKPGCKGTLGTGWKTRPLNEKRPGSIPDRIGIGRIPVHTQRAETCERASIGLIPRHEPPGDLAAVGKGCRRPR